MSASPDSAALPKVRIATTSLAGCFGCHMSFLDIDERILDLIKIAEFDRSPITDIKHCGPCDIALIEGGVCNAENVACAARDARQRQDPGRHRRLRDQRRPACDAQPSRCRDILNEVYRDVDGIGAHVPNDPELPLLFDKVYPVNEVVRVDYFIPGCPPSADTIWKYLNDLILGRMPRLDHDLMRYD